MKTRIYISAAAFLAICTTPIAQACEFHGGFGSTYQSKWQSYAMEQTEMAQEFEAEKERSAAAKAEAKVKPKPMFSKAASRASNVAKDRVERKAKAREMAKTADRSRPGP